MADVSDESSCIHEDFENFVSPTVLQTNLTLETPKAFIEDLDESYEEFQNCVEDIVLEIIKKLHKNKKKIDFGNVIKNAIKVDISEVQTRKALDQLISRRMLRSVITRGKESFRIMNSNGSFVNPDKCTGECYVQPSNICEQIKALDVKMGQCLSVSNVVEELGKENKFLRNEIENLTGLLDSFTGIIERQAQSGMTGEQFSVQSEKNNVGSIRSENAVNLSLNSNNSDNNDEEVIIDSTSDNTSSIIVSKKSLQNKIKNQLNLVRREYKEKFYNQETSLNKDDLLTLLALGGGGFRHPSGFFLITFFLK